MNDVVAIAVEDLERYEKAIEQCIRTAIAHAQSIIARQKTTNTREKVGIFTTSLRSELTHQSSFNADMFKIPQSMRLDDMRTLTNVENWADIGVFGNPRKEYRGWGSRITLTHIDPRTEQPIMTRDTIANLAENARSGFNFPASFKMLEEAIYEMKSATIKQNTINQSAEAVRTGLAKVATDIEPELATTH